MMLAERDRLRGGSGIRNAATRLARTLSRRIGHERERDIHLGILWKRFGARHVDRASRALETIDRGSQARNHVVGVAQQKISQFDEYAAA
jgi:hypothetical protein